MKYLILLLPLVIFACNLQGVKDDQNNLKDTTITISIDSNKTQIQELLPDSINGKVNEMVYFRKDGLRIEWTVKDTSNPIRLNDVVMVNYTARVAAGEVYDSNKEVGYPLPLKTNIGMLIKGWEEGLLQMHVGDKGRIMIPNALAYGEDGYLNIVPPQADIIVDIEIVSKIEPIVLAEGVKVYKWQENPKAKTPIKNQLITFDYFAFTKGPKGRMYDNSYQNGVPFSFKFENANVVDGLHQGMSVMREGENAFIEIPYKLAYGKAGLIDHVPSKTDIVYDVRIISIQ